MGTEVSEDDVLNILNLCDQVIALSEYRAQLYDYLKSRMAAVAPNLTVLVGELVGARLIAHVGSLINLAKAPASTIQILGAEKALFRWAGVAGVARGGGVLVVWVVIVGRCLVSGGVALAV
jgi:nucleolar protein 58